MKIVTKHPFAPLLLQLATPSHNVILPKEAADQYGDFNKAEAAIGTGPFILERYERGIKLLFKRNPDYYIKGLPYVDGIEWQITPEIAARVALLRTGKVELTGTTGLLAGEEALPLEKTNPELVLQVPGPGLGEVLHAHGSASFQRHPGAARSLPGDQSGGVVGGSRLWRGVLRHRSHPVCVGGVEARSLGLDPARAKYLVGFDREEAKRLLAEAGYPKGFTTLCIIIPVIQPPGRRAMSWRWTS